MTCNCPVNTAGQTAHLVGCVFATMLPARSHQEPQLATLEALWNGDIALTAEQRQWIRQALDVQDRADDEARRRAGGWKPGEWAARRLAGGSPLVAAPCEPPRDAAMAAFDRTEFDALLTEVVALREWKAAQEAAAFRAHADTRPELQEALQQIVNRARNRLVWLDLQEKAVQEACAACDTTISNIVEIAEAALAERAHGEPT